MSPPIRVLVFLEAQSVTGPARNLLEFCRLANEVESNSGAIELTIAAYRRTGTLDRDPLREAAEAQQIPFIVIPERRSVDFGTLRKMRAVCAQVAPDLIQTHGVKASFLVWLSGFARRYPWIAWHHGYARPSLLQDLYSRFDKLSLRNARAVVTVTKAFVPELRRAGVSIPIEIIPNAIHPGWMDGCPLPSLAHAGAKVVLAVGRLSKEKAHADLVKALGILRRAGGAALHLLLVGDGPERQRLVELAEAEGVAMTLAGQVDDVRPYLAACDYFVLPSHSEGSPNALIEAMAAGLPIVATAVGGVPEMVTDGEDVLLVPSSRPDLLAVAIERVQEDPALTQRLGDTAAVRAREKFRPEPRVRRIMKLYRGVVGTR